VTDNQLKGGSRPEKDIRERLRNGDFVLFSDLYEPDAGQKPSTQPRSSVTNRVSIGIVRTEACHPLFFILAYATIPSNHPVTRTDLQTVRCRSSKHTSASIHLFDIRRNYMAVKCTKFDEQTV